MVAAVVSCGVREARTAACGARKVLTENRVIERHVPPAKPLLDELARNAGVRFTSSRLFRSERLLLPLPPCVEETCVRRTQRPSSARWKSEKAVAVRDFTYGGSSSSRSCIVLPRIAPVLCGKGIVHWGQPDVTSTELSFLNAVHCVVLPAWLIFLQTGHPFSLYLLSARSHAVRATPFVVGRD